MTSPAASEASRRRGTEGSNIVLLEPDVAAAFPNAAAVNNALRSLMRDKGARRKRPRARRSPKRGA